jgi:hypothetical protein
MNTDFEDLVAQTLQLRAATVRIPANLAGLAHRARKQYRRRRWVLSSGLTAMTAAGLAVVVPLATQAGPQPTASLPHAETVAYIIRHTERGIAARIEVARDTGPWSQFLVALPLDGRPIIGLSGSVFTAHSSTEWSYGPLFRAEYYAADARPLYDQNSINSPAVRRTRLVSVRNTDVDYLNRTWWRTSFPAVGISGPPASCNPKGFGPLPQAIEDPANYTPSVPWLRYYLRCGSYRLAGRQHVGGINAIKIVSPRGGFRQVIWVNPATWLPVQSLIYFVAGGYQKQLCLLTDFHWLAATPRNLALLNVPIPAGFRRVKG